MITLTSKSVRLSVPIIRRCCTRNAAGYVAEEEYTAEPHYPEIIDTRIQARRLRTKQAWYDEIKAVKTVEEKLIKINIPRYYGWRSILLLEDYMPFDPLPFMQHCTRTHFICQNTLPDHYLSMQPAAEALAAQIKDEIEDCLIFENNTNSEDILKKMKTQNIQKLIEFQDNEEPDERNNEIPEPKQNYEGEIENAKTYNILLQFNRIISNHLAKSLPHISEMQVDLKPRHEAFWFTGGLQNSHKVRKSREGFKYMKEFSDVPEDRPFQYKGKTLMALRGSLPLEPFLPYSEAENPDFTVPKYIYSPETAGFGKTFLHAANIPGFWPGDKDEFGLISFHGRGHMLHRVKSFGEPEHEETLHAQGILSCFSWLRSQSCYQGFDPYNDITYPLVNQSVITNGRLWSFYAYQLNTTKFFETNIDTNPKRNVCYGTKPLQLYESIEDGKVVGFNVDVLKLLLQFYMNEPRERANTEMKPYLGKTEKVIADIKEPERRAWLEDRFKHLISNRPRHELIPEIYHWEKIYKIDHKTRPLEAPKRPFEKHIDPFKRRLDSFLRRYIPRCYRPTDRRNRRKQEKIYYP